MEKINQKTYKTYNANILQGLCEKYGLSKYYIRKCLAGNAHGIKPENIRKDYSRIEKAINNVIMEFMNKGKE